MASYHPPDKQSNRKRNKTGYNMFFSAHVLRLKQTESGVPSERGSVARLVGTAWKQLSAEEKQFYEREADRHKCVSFVFIIYFVYFLLQRSLVAKPLFCDHLFLLISM